jgi:hypothetical protein
VTPGVFADPDAEREFIERLKQAPPALVLWPKRPFDDMFSRSVAAQAPLLTRWVWDNYKRVEQRGYREVILLRRG